VTQELEIGSWYQRRRGAGSLVQAADARVGDATRVAALEVRLAYVTLALAERRAALTDSSAAFAERLAAYARREFESGETNRLELNATILEAARARSLADRAAAAATAAAADLGRLLGLPGDSTVRTAGFALPAAGLPPSDSVLFGLARSRRPDLAALDASRRGSEQLLSAARWDRLPVIAVSAVGSEESGTDRLRGFVIGLQVPLFHRQQSAIGAAEADQAAALAAYVASDRAIRAELRAASARYRRSVLAERRFATEVLQSAEENVRLTERALREGEVGLTDVLVLRGTAVAAQLEYLDVLGDAAVAWYELAASLGAEPAELPTLFGNGN